MKHIIAGLAAVATIGAVVGAGYVYYKKSKENVEDYEEYIFTDEMDGEFGEVEPLEETVEDVVIVEDVVPQENPEE